MNVQKSEELVDWLASKIRNLKLPDDSRRTRTFLEVALIWCTSITGVSYCSLRPACMVRLCVSETHI